MAELYASPYFSIVLSIACYGVGVWLNQKFRSAILNPLLISIVLVSATLIVLDIPLAVYNNGGGVIAMFLAPATACLALTIYRKFDVLKANLLPLLAGTIVGSGFSMGSVYLLCKLLGLDEAITISLLPKSVTTPMAMEISAAHGGIVPVSVMAVVVTGILGAVMAPVFIKLFRVKNPVEAGVAIGVSSHALGTSKAIELGETEGAMSSIAMGLSGIITVLFAMFIK